MWKRWTMWRFTSASARQTDGRRRKSLVPRWNIEALTSLAAADRHCMGHSHSDDRFFYRSPAVVGKSKSWFDLNHDWITYSDLIWKTVIWFRKRVIWFRFDLKFYDLIWNHPKSQKIRCYVVQCYCERQTAILCIEVIGKMSISTNNWICTPLTTSIIRHSGVSVLNVRSHHQSNEGQIDSQNCGGAAVQNGEQQGLLTAWHLSTAAPQELDFLENEGLTVDSFIPIILLHTVAYACLLYTSDAADE